METCLAVGNIQEQVYEFVGVAHGASTRKQKYGMLVSVLQKKLDLYPTSLKEDEDLLDKGKMKSGTTLNYHPKTAIRFRASEKRLLLGLIKYLKGKGADLSMKVEL